jgi:selenocysteine lyase/cysteine desulfurase
MPPRRLTLCTPLGSEQSASIVGFGIIGLSGAIEGALARQGVLVGAVAEESIRVAVHVYNTLEEFRGVRSACGHVGRFVLGCRGCANTQRL